MVRSLFSRRQRRPLLVAGRDQLLEDGRALQNVFAVVVPGRALVAVALVRPFDGVAHAAVVAAGRGLQLLVRAQTRELLPRRLDVVREYLRAERDERVGVGLPSPCVARLPRNRVLDVYLHDADAVEFAALFVA